MTLNELLNSDLTTLQQEARRGFDWWIEELAALVPPSLQRFGQRRRPMLLLDKDGWHDAITGEALATVPRDGSIIAIDEDELLVRNVTVPPMSGSQVSRMLALDAGRYFPMPPETILLAAAPRRERTDDGLMPVDVAALPMTKATAIADALCATGLTPAAVRVVREGRLDLRFDFLPLMQHRGLLGRRRSSYANWWAVVGALAFLNLAVLFWRDAADVARLQALVDSQRPAVTVAQRITAQMRAMNARAQNAALQRGQSEPLATLAVTTQAVPDGAWVQRYAWNGTTLRLTGYRSRDTDVASAFRKVPEFANVRSAQTDSIAETATGQPFDLVAEIGQR